MGVGGGALLFLAGAVAGGYTLCFSCVPKEMVWLTSLRFSYLVGKLGRGGVGGGGEVGDVLVARPLTVVFFVPIADVAIVERNPMLDRSCGDHGGGEKGGG